MDNLSPETKKILEYLPSWMEITKNPDSNAARFIDAFGIEFTELQEILLNLLNNAFLSTADTSLIDYAYSVDIQNAYIEHAESFEIEVNYSNGDKAIIPMVSSFYALSVSANVCAMIDEKIKTCIIRRDPEREYSSINIIVYDETNTRIGQLNFVNLILHHVWNVFDEIGLILGLNRLKKESNEDYKRRLNMIFTNPPGTDKDGIINSLAIELDIPKEEVEVCELFEYAFANSLLNEDGSASKKLESYASIINEQIKNTWDTMNWDTTYWKTLESAEYEFDYLPHIWGCNLDNWKTSEIQSGVGADIDLLLKAPVQNKDSQDFTYSIGVSGMIDSGYLYYPEHTFDFRIYATGNENSLAERKLNYRYTIIAAESHSVDGKIAIFTEREYENYRAISTTNTENDSIEIIPGNVIRSPETIENLPASFLKITSTLKANNSGLSPGLSELSFTYIDQNDEEQIVTLNTNDLQLTNDLLSGDYPRISNSFIKTHAPDGMNIITLAPTQKNIVIDKPSEWSSGAIERCYIDSKGRLAAK